jgi:hypothetical protein
MGYGATNNRIISKLQTGSSVSTVGIFRALVEYERERSRLRLTAWTDLRIKEAEFCEMSEEGALLQ